MPVGRGAYDSFVPAQDSALEPRAQTVSRGDSPLLAAALLSLYAALIVVAHLWGSSLARADVRIGLEAPPLFGRFDPRFTFRILPAVAFAAFVVIFGHRSSAASSWRTLLVSAFAGAAVWALALAWVDGWRAVVAPVLSPLDAYSFLHRLAEPAAFLRTFTINIESSPIHVQSHPPGLPLLLYLLDSSGLGSAGIVAAIFIAAGAAAAPAVLVAVKAVSGEPLARSAAPWLVLAPYAVWIATSADALYAGVAAWAVALIVSSESVNRLRPFTGGLLFGGGLFLTYGAAALAVIPAAVAVARRSFKPLAYAAVGTGFVLAAFGFFGFWWLDGLQATRIQYYKGLAGFRPYSYFLLSNLAALAIGCGPAALVGLAAWRGKTQDATIYLVAGGLLAVSAANLSGLSKGEVERIWLLFMPWIVLAAAFIVRGGRWWLASSAASAILVQVLVVTPW